MIRATKLPQPDKRERIKEMIKRLRKAHPDAKLALNFSTPLELLVALILAAQCTDERVNQVTSLLFKKYRSTKDYLSLPREKLEAEIRPTGFYHQKAKTILTCAQVLLKEFDGNIPDNLENLLTLPGVGRKTANILIGNAFGRPAIGVDTHVGRLSQRLGLTKNTNPDKIEADLVEVSPQRDWVSFCHLLQFQGRRVCLARKPLCQECTINDLCSYPEKTVET